MLLAVDLKEEQDLSVALILLQVNEDLLHLFATVCITELFLPPGSLLFFPGLFIVATVLSLWFHPIVISSQGPFLSISPEAVS